jgi:hypothetical protein
MSSARVITKALSLTSKLSPSKKRALLAVLASRFTLKTEELCLSENEVEKAALIAEVQQYRKDEELGETTAFYFYRLGEPRHMVEVLIAFHPETIEDYEELIEDLKQPEGDVIKVVMRTPLQAVNYAEIKARFINDLTKDLTPPGFAPRVATISEEDQCEEDESVDQSMVASQQAEAIAAECPHVKFTR